MKRFITIIAIMAAASFGLAGCAGNAVKKQLSDPKMQGYKNIEIAEISAQYQGHVLKVQAQINNKNKKNARVFYRFRWLDAQNMVVSANEQWKPILIYGKQSAYVTDAAPNADVTDYRLEFNVEYPVNQ